MTSLLLHMIYMTLVDNYRLVANLMWVPKFRVLFVVEKDQPTSIVHSQSYGLDPTCIQFNSKIVQIAMLTL